jgi:predicted secreted protein
VLAALAVVLALIVVALLAADIPRTSSVVRVNEADLGRSVMLRTGDILQVTLAGNISTGYVWELVQNNPDVLRPMGEQEVVPRSSAPGTGEQVITRFEAVGAGTVYLSMLYRRQFEESGAPRKTFQLEVIVESRPPR